MESFPKTLPALFEQLGLDSDPKSIDSFISSHRIPKGVALSDAEFWSPAQAALLREELQEDADWEPIVDELNVLLHQETRAGA